MELETERLRIRYFSESDLDEYSEIVADPDVMKFLDGPQTRNAAFEYILEMINHHHENGLGRYAVDLKSSGRLIGFCGFWPAGHYVDFGYRYAKSTWGMGIGLEAALAVRQYGLDTLLMKNMEAGAAVQNGASIKILDQMGFKYREELVYDGYDAVRYRDTHEDEFLLLPN